LQGVASHGGQNRRRLSDARNVVDESSRLRITLGPDYVWTGLVEGLNRGLQVANVLPALFDFTRMRASRFSAFISVSWHVRVIGVRSPARRVLSTSCASPGLKQVLDDWAS
jgi:hypothetical protein